MVTIPEEHPMMQYVLRFILVYSLSEPSERSQTVQQFASTIAEREQELRTALTGLVAQLPQPNLDDPDLDAAIDFANATLAKIA